MSGRGQRSVSGRDIGMAVTGDYNRIGWTPEVRSAYREQVRRIAPPELIDRETELTQPAVFCTDDDGPAYAWWRAGAWAGKTALMSWFALHPPKGVRVVPFFVTARLGAQNDATAFVDVVLEQLAELVGEGLPAYLTQATGEAHLLHLYGEAERMCKERGARLVLLVDGLDEDRGVTTGPDAHSIASLLPPMPDAGMRVMVSGRLSPPLPGDVLGNHPLRDPAVVRTLRPSSYAQVIRVEAENELKRLIRAGGLEYELLAFVTAEGGGLTAEDLAALTDAVPCEVRDVLRTRAGRTFGTRVDLCLLGHEELQDQAEDMLGGGLGFYRGELTGWAERWRDRGWPRGTPEYLLRGYFRMLRATGDLDAMLTCALDPVRHDRMQELTGGDAAAVNEIRATEELIAERDARPLSDCLRLAVERERLGDRSEGLPQSLPAAWAMAGQLGRGLALARSFPSPYQRGLALAGVARALLEGADDADRAEEVFAEAEECARDCDTTASADVVRTVLTDVMMTAGHYDRAAGTVSAIRAPHPGTEPYGKVVRAWVAAGRRDRAEELVC